MIQETVAIQSDRDAPDSSATATPGSLDGGQGAGQDDGRGVDTDLVLDSIAESVPA